MNFNADMETFGQRIDASTNFSLHIEISDEERAMHIMYEWHRDSDAVTRANVKVFKRELAKVDPDETHWSIHEFNHWACGWTAILIVTPDTAAYTAAYEMHCAVSDYPVLDDEMIGTCDACEALYLREDDAVETEQGTYCSEHCRDETESEDCAECGHQTPSDEIIWRGETPYCDEECAGCHQET